MQFKEKAFNVESEELIFKTIKQEYRQIIRRNLSNKDSNGQNYLKTYPISLIIFKKKKLEKKDATFTHNIFKLCF